MRNHGKQVGTNAEEDQLARAFDLVSFALYTTFFSSCTVLVFFIVNECWRFRPAAKKRKEESDKKGKYSPMAMLTLC